MKATKKVAVNYTDTDIQALSAYTGKDNKAEISAIAEKIGKSPASVRAKLANMGLYKKDVSVAGKKGGVKKDDIAGKVGEIVGLNDSEVEALAKTTIPVLTKVLGALTNKAGDSAE